MKKYPVLLGIGVVVALLFFVWIKNPTRTDSLRFSNTMEWDPNLSALVGQKTHYALDWERVVALPPYPKNSSEETREELAMLVGYVSLRTKEKLDQITAEIDLQTTPFGDYFATDYFDGKKFPATARLFKDSFSDLFIIIVSEKKKYDRVRPHILEPKIEPVIPVPGHPAYPSGHSTQAHFMAYVLGELIPSHKEAFIARADEIAKNREIAGLHYPSDSKVGMLLARQFLDALLQNDEFKSLLKDAKNEWRNAALKKAF